MNPNIINISEDPNGRKNVEKMQKKKATASKPKLLNISNIMPWKSEYKGVVAIERKTLSVAENKTNVDEKKLETLDKIVNH